MGNGGSLSVDRFRNGTWWLTMAAIVGAAVGFAIWLGVGLVHDRQLADRGVVVTATVKDIRPLRKTIECLASYTLDGRAYDQWTDSIANCRIGRPVTIILDPRDRDPLMSTDVYDERWKLHVLQLPGVAVPIWFAIYYYRRSKRWS